MIRGVTCTPDLPPCEPLDPASQCQRRPNRVLTATIRPMYDASR
jgi:hypothetical protein